MIPLLNHLLQKKTMPFVKCIFSLILISNFMSVSTLDIRALPFIFHLQIDEFYVNSENVTSLLSKHVREFDAIYNFSLVVLPISNSSVSFVSISNSHWSPIPPDYTLAPNESSAVRTYSLYSLPDNYIVRNDMISYSALALTAGSNATAQMRYYLSENPNTIDFSSPKTIAIIVIVSLVIVGVVVLYFIKINRDKKLRGY